MISLVGNACFDTKRDRSECVRAAGLGGSGAQTLLFVLPGMYRVLAHTKHHYRGEMEGNYGAWWVLGGGALNSSKARAHLEQFDSVYGSKRVYERDGNGRCRFILSVYVYLR